MKMWKSTCAILTGSSLKGYHCQEPQSLIPVDWDYYPEPVG